MISKKLIEAYIDEVLAPLIKQKYNESISEIEIKNKYYLDGMVHGLEICEGTLKVLIKEEN